LESPTSTVWKIAALLTTGPLVLPIPAAGGGEVEGAAPQLEHEHPLAQVGGGEEELFGGSGDDDDALALFADLELAEEEEPATLLKIWLFDIE
jgi:hypothetical protein